MTLVRVSSPSGMGAKRGRASSARGPWIVLRVLCLCSVFLAGFRRRVSPAAGASFATHADYETGPRPTSVAVGDFNGDGKPDFAVVNNAANTVSVLLGHGDGSFQAQRTFVVGSTPSSVAVGDFNGDGKPDLAVANNADATVSVLLGNGDGSFRRSGHSWWDRHHHRSRWMTSTATASPTSRSPTTAPARAR